MYKELEKYFIDVDKVIDDFAQNIAEEVATKRFYEMGDVKAIAATRLNFALHELLAIQSNGIEAEIELVKKRLSDMSISGKSRAELCGQLSLLNGKKRDYNRAIAAKRDKEDLRQFKLFIREKYGLDVWRQFEEWQNNLNSKNTISNEQ